MLQEYRTEINDVLKKILDKSSLYEVNIVRKGPASERLLKWATSGDISSEVFDLFNDGCNVNEVTTDELKYKLTKLFWAGDRKVREKDSNYEMPPMGCPEEAEKTLHRMMIEVTENSRNISIDKELLARANGGA